MYIYNKLNFSRSWLTGSQQQSVEIANEAETLSETLYPRHELIDYQRIGCNIYVAPPHYNLAAITDNLSRITLIDTVRGVMIRMWKGYREAQCGFIEVTEARNRKDQSAGTSNRRSGLFLIIYAPRKSILEIWCLQKGPKVATFQASSHGLLIYNNHSEMPHKSKSSRASCLFFDADDCSLKSFSIPFHCILSEANSRSAEDFHFLKRLKMMLKNVDLKDPSGVNGIIELCSKFQTPEIKLKCLELLTSYRKSEPDIIQAVIEVFLAAPEALEEGTVENDDSIQDGIYRNQLKASCLNHQSLVNCFLMTKEAVEENAEGDLKNTSIELLDNEYLTVQRIVELMNLSTSKDLNSTAKNVSFKDSDNTVVSFLTSFIVNNDHIAINTEKHLNAFDHIGSVLFSPAWKEEIPAEKLRDIFMTSRIASEDTMKCFLYFWLQQEINFSDEDHVLAEMTKFKNILDQVCASAGDKVTYAYNSICLFWQDVREYLLESNYPINSLLAAIICKNFALKKQDESQDFGFEQVTQEECQWTLLTEKLNDVAVLSIFVSQFGSDRQSSSKVKYEVPSISLKKILNDGRGVISELVASWLIGVHLPIDLIFKSSTDETLDDEERNFTKKLEILRQHFPYSLNAAVILCYVIWDLLCRWSKDLSELQYLKNGIQNLNLFSEKDYHLKHGLCVLLWNANFKIPLKATQRLVNKTGRLPKEKLCLQNTMIPDFLIPQFLEQTLLFLDHFRNSMKYNELEFKCEEILTQGSSAPSQSLCELLLQQKRANLPLLNLHYEMIMALELIAFLNIKYTKPMNSLFDDVANEAFFSDINKPLAYTLQKPDEIRVNTRVYFLKKAISTTFDLIVDCHQGVFFDDHFKWIEKIKRIGNVWELDIGLLDRHHVSKLFRTVSLINTYYCKLLRSFGRIFILQILELYVNAFDEVAEELLEKAPARESIVKHLLDIAAKRLTLYLDGNKSGWVHVSSGGSLLINYLETIHSRKDDVLLENLKQSSMAKLYNLTYKIFQIASAKNFSDSRTLRCVIEVEKFVHKDLKTRFLIFRLAGQMLDVTLLLKDGE